MKHIKLFEELNQNVPHIGYYAIANSNDADEETQNFFLTHIGKISSIFHDKIDIEYVDVPEDLSYGSNWDDNCYMFKYLSEPNHKHSRNTPSLQNSNSEVLYWSKNREDLEDILTANKYNL